MSYKILAPDSFTRGKGRGRGYPPRPNNGRKEAPIWSAQGSYPICTDDEIVVAFVEFVHLHGTKILREANGAGAPEVYASLMNGAHFHIART
jgi:hypothetical protein